MQIGIFAKTFPRSNLEEVLDAVVSHGIRAIQFNFACAGVPSMPDQIDDALLDRIAREARARNITIAAVSGTFNMIHPDPRHREAGLRRLPVLAGAAQQLGIPVITLCTGSRDPDDMWRNHPENQSPQAWRDLTNTLSKGLAVAEQFNVTLGFEPEVSNVVDSALKGRRLLDEMQSPYLKVILDGANLFPAGQLPHMREILAEAFELLGPAIVIAHAKDLDRDGEAGHRPAGKGVLDYDFYLRGLLEVGFQGPLILHSLAESEVDECVNFVRARLAKCAGP